MTLEKWIIHPGETRVIDIEDVRKLKIGLVGGQIDVVAHDLVASLKGQLISDVDTAQTA